MRAMIVIGLLGFGLGLPMQGQQLRWLGHSKRWARYGAVVTVWHRMGLRMDG